MIFLRSFIFISPVLSPKSLSEAAFGPPCESGLKHMNDSEPFAP